MRERSTVEPDTAQVATTAQKAAGFVTCPLCHMAEVTMADDVIEKSAGWQCTRCDQRWDATRLATVGAYAAWVAAHDARLVDSKITNFSTRLNL
jgi:transcription elongation factor Elf1